MCTKDFNEESWRHFQTAVLLLYINGHYGSVVHMH